MSTRAEQRWWDGAVVYQVYPRSFADHDGDGLGDLRGVLDHVDHIARLGVDAVWLSPFYPSPMADMGYDVADHCDVDPRFGTLADIDAVIAAAHDRGLRVIVDIVPNHTSDQHPWFLASRRSRDDEHRGWYIWADSAPDGGPPNNWRANFTGDTEWVRDDDGQLVLRRGLGEVAAPASSAWTWDDATGQWYLHTFLPEQPDLEWRHPAVEAAQHDVLRFWLDRGVDGFRVDAIVTLGKPEGLPDVPPELAALPEAGLTDHDFTRDKIRRMQRVLAERGPGHMMLGEVAGDDVAAVRAFVGPELFDLAFVWPALRERWDPDGWRTHVDAAEHHHGDGTEPAWVLSNHDLPRHADRYGSEARARAAAVLLLTLRGAAVIYAGEELGLVDADIDPAQRIDPGGRDGCRAPIPWTAAPGHGWGPEPWLPFPRNAATHHVEAQEADPGSMLHLYRRLLAARRASPALRTGRFTWLDAPAGVLAWARATEGDERRVVVSFVARPTTVAVDGDWQVEISSQGDHDRPWDGHLAPDEAVVLRPR